MNKEISRNIRLGLFVIAGIVLLIFGLYSIGSNKNMFTKSFTLESYFYDVNGLSVGNNVRYSGIDVGTVQKIEIINDSSVRVVMIIEEKLKDFIRKNSIASIGTDGLMGNKLVNISAGTSNASMVENNDRIASLKAVNTDEMLRTLDMTNSNIALISANLKDITQNVYQSRGTLYTVLMDTALARSVSQSIRNIEGISLNLKQTSVQLASLVSDVNGGKGPLGVMLKDTALSGDLKTSVEKIKEGSEEFSRITKDVSVLMQQINSGNGVVNGLLTDSLMADELKKSITNLQSASQKLDQDLEALQHSFLLRRYFRGKSK
ncbi:MAG: MCE family protein [Bacteroidetes bacterium]|nr:MCE family protein [Bacteroidota bacterium]